MSKNSKKLELAVGIIFLLAIWQIVASGVGNFNIFPTPLAVLIAFKRIVTKTDFIATVFFTLFRVVVSLSISFILAVILGFFSVNNKYIKAALSPLVSIMKATPTIAITVQLIIWLGPYQAPSAVGFIIVFPILYSAVLEGISNVDPEILEMADIYNIPNRLRVKKIYIPSVVSYLSAALAGAIGLSMKVIISAEYISTTKYSLGNGIYYGFAYFNMDEVWAWAAIAIITSAILEYPIMLIKKRLCQWREVDV
ncbi:ABC transporter permease subunit [Clostridium sp. 'deep sea']|uniref:ABC transporter permease n=1 Tax=Clostridium sp. 'deep sea' TaxID=2779445 RepID=UPI0018964208|nr:ABC transporter permease subunit [Clostridium sp. 'deep sea']QOR34007.1 ABC transporter permease subunit [Clostridium sp. 'deep sea']